MNSIKYVYVHKQKSSDVNWLNLLKLILPSEFYIIQEFAPNNNDINLASTALFFIELTEIDTTILSINDYCYENEIPIICAVEKIDDNLKNFISQKHIEGWINSQFSLEELKLTLSTKLKLNKIM